MIAAGGLDGVDGIFATHLDTSRSLGRIGVRNGPLTASCDEIEIRIAGRGGHAARPHESIDPLAAAAKLVLDVYALLGRTIDAHQPVVVTFGQLAAGDNANVIPERAFLRGTLRCFDTTVRRAAKETIHRLARATAEATQTSVEVAFHHGIDSVRNDAVLTNIYRRVGADLLGPENVEEIPLPSLGGEDFANYLKQVPGSMFRLGCTSARAGGLPLHSSGFDFDERALAIGAKMLALSAVELCRPDGL